MEKIILGIILEIVGGVGALFSYLISILNCDWRWKIVMAICVFILFYGYIITID